MHVKIQGGGKGRTANTGSSYDVTKYLQHEDLERIKEGKEVEHFFSHTEDKVDPDKIVRALDNNRKKLSKKDAKFFMLTVSPSEEELKHLSGDPAEQAKWLKEFTRKHVMQRYAQAFNKGLNAEDLMYFGKIHHHRKKSQNKEDLHVHILVSRKTKNGKIRISPQTNHKNTRKGPVKGGFSRVEFFENVEKDFDKRFLYFRRKENQFDFKKRYKKAKPAEVIELQKEKIEYNADLEQKQTVFKEVMKEKEISQDSLIKQLYDQRYPERFSHADSGDFIRSAEFVPDSNGNLIEVDFMNYISNIIRMTTYNPVSQTEPDQQKQRKKRKWDGKKKRGRGM